MREGGPDGHHFVVPVPLALARGALALAPQEAQRLSCPQHAARYLPAARRMLAELQGLPDAELIKVEERDQRVSVRVRAGQLVIDVNQADQEVHVVVPLEAAQRALDAYSDGGFESADLIAALGSISNTDLVHVRDGQDEVKVWIW